jgi:hypothetical protein
MRFAVLGRRLRSSALLPVVVALLAYLLIGWGAGRPSGIAGDPSFFIKAGDAFVAPELLPTGSFVERNSTGHDGQFFFYIAQDPLLSGKAASRDQVSSPHIDNVAYRYQRILFPALGWLTSWGDPDILQWTLPGLNLLALLGAGFLLARFCVRRGRSPWLSLIFMLSVASITGVVNDVSDPFAAGLFVAGMVWWMEERHRLAVLALAGCVLAREVYMIPVALICTTELARRRRSGLIWLAPLALWAAWQAYLRLALAASPTFGAHKPSLVPFVGAVRRAKTVLQQDAVEVAHWELLFIGVVLLSWLLFAVYSAGVLRDGLIERRLPSRTALMPLVGLAAGFLTAFYTPYLWMYARDYTRQSTALAGVLVLTYVLRPRREPLALLVALVALTLTNPIVALLPTDHGPSVG